MKIEDKDWYELCSLLDCSPDLPTEDVIRKVHRIVAALAKARKIMWKQPHRANKEGGKMRSIIEYQQFLTACDADRSFILNMKECGCARCETNLSDLARSWDEETTPRPGALEQKEE